MQRTAEQCFRPPGSDAPIPSLTQRRSLYTRYAIIPFPSISAAAVKLLSLHATTAAAERNWSGWGRIYKNALRNRLSVSTAEKLVYIKANLACEADPRVPELEPGGGNGHTAGRVLARPCAARGARMGAGPGQVAS